MGRIRGTWNFMIYGSILDRAVVLLSVLGMLALAGSFLWSQHETSRVAAWCQDHGLRVAADHEDLCVDPQSHALYQPLWAK